MLQTTPRFHPILIGLLSVYLFIYPWAILLIAIDQVPVWGTWVGGMLLVLQGTMMGVWLSINYGKRGALASLLILIISWAVEHIGETTGFPFGSYEYTDVLVPKIAGGVPLAIPFAWLLVIPAAVGVTDRLMGGRAHMAPSTLANRLASILVAASFATLLDVAIEPVAVHINGYWVWHESGGYYGVPVSNFAGWWMTSVLLVWILLWLRHPTRLPSQPRQSFLERSRLLAQPAPSRWSLWIARLPLRLYLLNLTMFVLVNLAHGHIAATVIGGLILGYVAFDWIEPWVVRWVLGIPHGDRRQPGA